jgi:hypothetical protein
MHPPLLCSLKTTRDFKKLNATVTHLAEGLCPETLLTLKMEDSLISLAVTRKLTQLIIEQSTLFLKILRKRMEPRFSP